MNRPWLRFVLLGALLFVGDAWRDSYSAMQAPAARLAPDASDEEVWLAEAWARGLHRSDLVVRQRLVRNMRFARPDDPRDDEALFEEALALGMHRTDLVARRRLVARLELDAARRARERAPSEAELAAYLAAHEDRYRDAPRARIEHLFFRDRARAETAAAALSGSGAADPGADSWRAAAASPPSGTAVSGSAQLVRAMRAISPPSAGGAIDVLAARWGDPPPVPARLPLHTEAELARRLGPDFARAVFAWLDEVGEDAAAFSPPIRSTYGYHLVRAVERQPARVPPLDVIRSAVREAWLAERGSAAVRRELERLRRRWVASPGATGEAAG